MSDSLSSRDGSFAVNNGDRAVDREQVLFEIDSFLRTAALPEKLAKFVTAEPPGTGDKNAAHHPDAAQLLLRAHERQPKVAHFAAATLRAALRGMLYDRWTMAVARRLVEQPAAVIERVLTELARFAPSRCFDDVWLVWCKLEKKFPHNEEFDYSERQIRGAWREVNAERRRWDAAGGGPQVSPAQQARQACKAALRRAAAEAQRPCRELAHLMVVDYEPLGGALRLPTAADESRVLSWRGRKRMATWLAIRGAGEGRLFALPAAVEYAIECDGLWRDLDERPDGHAIDAAERLEEADLIEHVCDSDDVMATDYLRENVVTAGDWPEQLLASLDQRCSSRNASADGKLSPTRHQRRLGRARCIGRWRSLT